MTTAESAPTARDAGGGQHAEWLAYYLGEEIFLRGVGQKVVLTTTITISSTELAGIVEAVFPYRPPISCASARV